jgi:hypothetical protein
MSKILSKLYSRSKMMRFLKYRTLIRGLVRRKRARRHKRKGQNKRKMGARISIWKN